MPYNTMSCNTMPYNTIKTMQYNKIQWKTTQCNLIYHAYCPRYKDRTSTLMQGKLP